MPGTYKLIASNTLSTSLSTVSFFNIPPIYKDLLLKANTRDDYADFSSPMRIRFNENSDILYSETYLLGWPSPTNPISGKQSSQSLLTIVPAENSNSATANTFSNSEIYIPNYAVRQNKTISSFGVPETNSVPSYPYLGISAGLWKNIDTITSITFIPGNGTVFSSGSSFFLYGIS